MGVSGHCIFSFDCNENAYIEPQKQSRVDVGAAVSYQQQIWHVHNEQMKVGSSLEK